MEAWHHFLKQMEREFGSEVIEQWLRPLKISRFDAGNLYLEASDSFQTGWFEEHIRPRLKDHLFNNNQRPIKVHVSTSSSKKEIAKKEALTSRFSIVSDSVDPEMALTHFLPSPQNIMAYKLMKELSGSPPFNPIYLYGPNGSGKTHLLMGAAAALQKEGKKVFYVRAETFTEHVVQAMRLGHMQEFRKIYRDMDVLIIDGIQIFSKKTATQEEFFHTFNSLHTLGRLILLSANTAPSSLIEIEPRLISRFEWGISIPLEKGDPLPILKKKAALWNLSLSSELLQFLLEKFNRDPIFALHALALRLKSREGVISLEIGQPLLRDLLEEEEKKALTSEKIIKSIAAHFGIKGEDLLGKSQVREHALPRQIAMYLCRERLKMAYQKIGQLFDRDHSTVMSSVKLVQKEVDQKKIEVMEAFASIE